MRYLIDRHLRIGLERGEEIQQLKGLRQPFRVRQITVALHQDRGIWLIEHRGAIGAGILVQWRQLRLTGDLAGTNPDRPEAVRALAQGDELRGHRHRDFGTDTIGAGRGSTVFAFVFAGDIGLGVDVGHHVNRHATTMINDRHLIFLVVSGPEQQHLDLVLPITVQ